jgi:hypothetical protein
MLTHNVAELGAPELGRAVGVAVRVDGDVVAAEQCDQMSFDHHIIITFSRKMAKKLTILTKNLRLYTNEQLLQHRLSRKTPNVSPKIDEIRRK